MNRTCIICGCLCLTGLRIEGRMLCRGCETALLTLKPQPLPALMTLYQHIPEAHTAAR